LLALILRHLTSPLSITSLSPSLPPYFPFSLSFLSLSIPSTSPPFHSLPTLPTLPSSSLAKACGNFFASCAARAAASSHRAEAAQEREMLRSFLAHSASLRSAGLERPIPAVRPLSDASAAAAASACSNLPAIGAPSFLSIPSTPFANHVPSRTTSIPSIPLHSSSHHHSRTFPPSPSSSASTVLPLLPSLGHGDASRGSGERSETHEHHQGHQGHQSHQSHEGHEGSEGHEDGFLRWAFEWQVCPSCLQLTTNPRGEGRGLIDDHGRAAPLACPSCGVAFPQRYTTSTVCFSPPSCLFVSPCLPD
jgi:hypothetical protein